MARVMVGVCLLGVAATASAAAADASPNNGPGSSHAVGHHVPGTMPAEPVSATGPSTTLTAGSSTAGQALLPQSQVAADKLPGKHKGNPVDSVPGNCQSARCKAINAVLLTADPTVDPPKLAPTSTPTAAPSPTANPAVPLPATVLTRGLTSLSPAPDENAPKIPAAPLVVPRLEPASGPWPGLSLKAASGLKLPILFGVAVLLFMLLQALVDRRDPKLARAPERGEDDTVGFC